MTKRIENYDVEDPRLTAYALGEMGDEDAKEFEAFLQRNPQAAAEVEAIRSLSVTLEADLANEPEFALSEEQRAAIATRSVKSKKRNSPVKRLVATGAVAAAVAGLCWALVPGLLRPEVKKPAETLAVSIEPPPLEERNTKPNPEFVQTRLESLGYASSTPGNDVTFGLEDMASADANYDYLYSGPAAGSFPADGVGAEWYAKSPESLNAKSFLGGPGEKTVLNALSNVKNKNSVRPGDSKAPVQSKRPVRNTMHNGEPFRPQDSMLDLPAANSEEYKRINEFLWDRAAKNAEQEGQTTTRSDRSIPPKVVAEYEQLVSELSQDLNLVEYARPELAKSPEFVQKVMEVSSAAQVTRWKEQIAAGERIRPSKDELRELGRRLEALGYADSKSEPESAEDYAHVPSNPFITVANDPRSTFSIDVDTASYSNVRRFLMDNEMLPPPDAVRIEELVNYFPYDYVRPDASAPFSTQVEIAPAPWKPEHRIVKIGLAGRELMFHERRNANLVFLIDVSGSMAYANKLPLLVNALSLLVEHLDPTDRVAIVVYAGSSGLVLDSTACSNRSAILDSLERLNAGGSTNGGAGIELAYRVARQNFVKGGVNRVILATDGDFNVGTTSKTALEELITSQAKTGVFLSVLGFGEGNLQDAKMEVLADKGNGNYAYIDSILEAEKVLVKQMGGTLVTIAKDVKIQVEFNPAKVQAFRLVGYENRMLEHQDFDDDTKDAGEIGSGHTVTALYEIVPSGVPFAKAEADSLRYQPTEKAEDFPRTEFSHETLTVSLRYKDPESSTSRKLVFPIVDKDTGLEDASPDFKFASAVASFGMLLRHSEYRGAANWDMTAELARAGLGLDVGGYRLEFSRLVEQAARLSRRR